jgi:hypothetical protein
MSFIELFLIVIVSTVLYVYPYYDRRRSHGVLGVNYWSYLSFGVHASYSVTFSVVLNSIFMMMLCLANDDVMMTVICIFKLGDCGISVTLYWGISSFLSIVFWRWRSLRPYATRHHILVFVIFIICHRYVLILTIVVIFVLSLDQFVDTFFNDLPGARDGLLLCNYVIHSTLYLSLSSWSCLDWLWQYLTC